MENVFSLLLDIRADVTGVKEATEGVRSIAEASQRFADTIRIGAGLDIGGRLVESCRKGIEALKGLVEEGIKFNKLMQTSEIGVSAVLRQFDPARYYSFDKALQASGSAIEALRKKALETPATFEQLVAGFQGVAGAAMAANVGLKQQVDVVALASQAMAALGIPAEQMRNELRSLYTGLITEDTILPKILGITKEDIDTAKEAGTLYDFLTKKLAAFGEAGKRSQDTYEVAKSNVQDAMSQLMGAFTKPIFEVETKGLLALKDALADPKTLDGIRTLALEMARFAESAAKLTVWAVQNAGALAELARVAVVLGVAIAGVKIGGAVLQFGQWIVTHWNAVAATEADTAALIRNTAATIANAGAKQAAALANAQAAASAGASAAANTAGAVMTGGSVVQTGRLIAGGPRGIIPELAQVAQGTGTAASVLAAEQVANQLALRTAIQGFFTTMAASAVVVFTISEALRAWVQSIDAGTQKVLDQTKAFSGLHASLAEQLAYADSSSKKVDVQDAIYGAILDKEREISAAEEARKGILARINDTITSALGIQDNEVDSLKNQLALLQKMQGTAALHADNRTVELRKRIELAQTVQDKESAYVAILNEVTRLTEKQKGQNSEGATIIQKQIDYLKKLYEQHAKVTVEIGQQNLKLKEQAELEKGLQDQIAKNAQEIRDGIVAMGTPQNRFDDLQSKYMAEVTNFQNVQRRAGMANIVPDHATFGDIIGVANGPLGGIKNSDLVELQETVKRIIVLWQEMGKVQKEVADNRKSEIDSNQELDRNLAIYQLEKEIKIAKSEGNKERARELQQEIKDLERAKDLKTKLGLTDEEALKRSKELGILESKDLEVLEKITEEVRRRIVEESNARMGLVNSDPFMLAAEKQSKILGELLKQKQALLAGPQDFKTGIDVAKINQQLSTMTFGGQIHGALTAWVNQFGTTAQQLAGFFTGTLTSAISGTSDAIYGLISGTANWNDALKQVEATALKSLIQISLQMMANWAIERGMRALGLSEEATHAAAKVGIHATGEAAKTAATATGTTARSSLHIGETIIHGIQVGIRTVAHLMGEAAMTAVTIAQSGLRIARIIAEGMVMVVKAGVSALSAMASIPFVGPVLAVAAMAAIIAAGTAALMSAGGFAEGGLIPGAPSRADNRIAHVATGEFVTRSDAVSYYGPAFFQALNEMRLPKMGVGDIRVPVASSAIAFAGGGLVGDLPPIGNQAQNISVHPAPVHVAVINSRDDMRRYLESSQGAGIIVDAVTRRKLELGIRS